jgi:hypothetical protein
MRIWFLERDSERLTPVTIDATDLGDTLTALLGGPDPQAQPHLTSTIPAETRLQGLRIDDGVLTIDLSRQFTTGGGSLSMMARVAEVVFTATEIAAVDGVNLSIDGEPLTVLGGEGIILDRPQHRDDWLDFQPFVMVDSPQPGTEVSSPVLVSGTNSTFENTVDIEISDDSGRVLARTFSMGRGPIHDSSGTPVWGAFATSVGIDPGVARSGVVTAFETSPEDGSRRAVFTVPVRFAPGGGPAWSPVASYGPASAAPTAAPDGLALLTDVRAAAHPGFERVVFEFERAVPGYDVGVTGEAITADPSDLPISLAADHSLLVRMEAASGVDLTGSDARSTYLGPDRLAVGLPAIREVVEVGDFEAVLTWAIAVSGTPRFAVSTLTNPPRVVVDVESAG